MRHGKKMSEPLTSHFRFWVATVATKNAKKKKKVRGLVAWLVFGRRGITLTCFVV